MSGAAFPPDGRAWLAASLCVVLLCFAEVIFLGGAFVGMDHAIEFLPTWSAQRASLLAGELPLWDPRPGAGTPLLAAVYGGALDPIRWAFYPLPCVTGYGLHVVFLHVVAAAGTFRLARRLGARPWVAAFAAVSLGAGGPFRSLGGFEAALASAAWVPWVLDAAFAYQAAPSLRRALGAGVLIALAFHGGLPEYALGCGAVFFAGALAGARAARSPRPLLVALAAPLVAGLLSLGVLLPALELARISTRRSGVAWEQITEHATHPLELATLLLPGIFGNTAREPWSLGRALFDQSYFLPVLYPGALACLLVPFAPWRRSNATRALLALLAFSLVFALGERAKLFTFVLTALPPLRVFRYAYKAWAFAAPALAVLSALGLEELLARGPRAARGLLIVVALAAVAASTGGALAVLRPERLRVVSALLGPSPPWLLAVAERGSEDAARALLLRGVTLGAVALGLVGAANARSARSSRLAFLAAFALLDLVVTSHRATTLVERDFFETRPFLARTLDGVPPARFYNGDANDLLPTRFERDSSRDYWEYQRERLRPNLAAFHEVHQLYNYNPGRLAWMNSLYFAIESTPPERRARLLASSGGDFVLSRVPLDHPRLDLAAETPSRPVQRLYRVKDALPRYQVVATAETFATHRQALVALAQGAAHPDRSVLLRADGAAIEPEDFEPIGASPDVLVTIALDPAARARLAPALEPAAAAKVVSLRPHRVEVELPERAAAGYLVARDAFEPRWRATVDGVPSPVERANFAFRAVRVPAGARRVVFEYDGTLARGAFAAQAACWALVGLALLLGWRRGAR